MSLFSGLSRPLKAAGLVLVGVAIVAAVIGGITLLNSGDKNETAQPGTSSTPPPGGQPSGSVPPPSPSPSPSPSAPPPSSSAAPPPSSPAAPPSNQPGQPGQPGGDQQASAKWVTVRVYNNSTIHGLAAEAAQDFRSSGWNVAEVSNYSAGIIPVTTAYYRPGTDEETAAKALATEFGLRAEARFDGIKESSPGVIVIVTNNYKTKASGGKN
jgi:hypothetical protein